MTRQTLSLLLLSSLHLGAASMGKQALSISNQLGVTIQSFLSEWNDEFSDSKHPQICQRAVNSSSIRGCGVGAGVLMLTYSQIVRPTGFPWDMFVRLGGLVVAGVSGCVGGALSEGLSAHSENSGVDGRCTYAARPPPLSDLQAKNNSLNSPGSVYCPE